MSERMTSSFGAFVTNALPFDLLFSVKSILYVTKILSDRDAATSICSLFHFLRNENNNVKKQRVSREENGN